MSNPCRIFHVWLLALVCVLPGCLTKQQPVTVSAPRAAADVMVAARRALSEQGLTASTQDDEAGVLYSDWVVMSRTEKHSWVYRLVVLVDEREGASSVTVRAEAQACPPDATVFDRCESTPARILPKAIQEKMEAIGHELAT